VSLYGMVTIHNVKYFVGKTVDRERRMFHQYPLTFKKINGEYFLSDKNGDIKPFTKDEEIIFDSIVKTQQRKPPPSYER